MLAVCALPLRAGAEAVIEKKLDNGNDSTRFVWVILAEGYTAAQHAQFNNDSTNLIDVLFAATPWKEYKSVINVYTIFSASDESGADHPSEGRYADTAFDATFDTYGMARLLTVNEAKALTAAARVPEFDTVFVLVNDKQYGGSGGSVIVASLHEASNEIVLHEAGHSIGRLADEYTTPYPGYPAGDSEPNVTTKTQRDRIKWRNWIEPDTPLPTHDAGIDSIGLFEGARYMTEGIYRPKYTCKMRSLNQPYCEICTEALVLNIYNYVSLFDTYEPPSPDIELAAGKPVTLGLDTGAGEKTGGFEVSWYIDDTVLDNETQPYLLLWPAMLTQGRHTVRVDVRDNTDMVKTDPQSLMASRHSWNLTKSFCSGILSGSVADARTGRKLPHLPLRLSKTGSGLQTDEAGCFELSDIACGVYTLTIAAPGYKSFSQEIAIVDAQEKKLPVALASRADAFYITGSIIGSAAVPCTITLSGNRSASITTDNSTGFTLGPLSPGDYTITPAAPGHVFFPPMHKIKIKDRDIKQLRFAAGRMSIPGTAP
jgi:hypothetical protein